MKKQAAAILTVLLLAEIVPPSTRASAQAPGYAEITRPTAGQTISGTVTIEGTADHPAFVRYDLAFAYDPNPTDTWYAVGEPVPTRARQGTLGLWETSGLSPGTYQLRLRVFLDSGAILEDTVTGLRVGLPAAAPVAGNAAPTATSTATPSAASTPIRPPPAPEGTTDPVSLALVIGGVMAAALLLLLAAYLPLRRGLALWAGNLRMRRVLRQDSRRRRGRGGS